MTHYLLTDAPLRTSPAYGERITTLAKFQLVEVLESADISYLGKPTPFSKVLTRTGEMGWVYSGYLSPYGDNQARLKIANPTPNPNDARQYLVYDGKIQYNLCGFFCIAECLDWRGTVEEMLDRLKVVKPSFMQAIFSPRNKGLTSAGDLLTVLKTFDIDGRTLNFVDPVSRTTIISAKMLEDMTHNNHVIIGVTINKQNGRLSRKGIRHWVTAESVVPMDYGGIVELYNPFGNRYECYGWDEFIESVGVPNGIVFAKNGDE